EAQATLAKYLRDYLGGVGPTSRSPDGHVEVCKAIIEERGKMRATINAILSDTKVWYPSQLLLAGMNERLIKVKNEQWTCHVSKQPNDNLTDHCPKRALAANPASNERRSSSLG